MICLCRAFKSILKCQRMKQYQPSAAVLRPSAPNNHYRARRSISCDFHTQASKRKLDSTSHRRISKENQVRLIASQPTRYIVPPGSMTSRKESTTNSTILRSLSAPDDTSPWHLRKPLPVR